MNDQNESLFAIKIYVENNKNDNCETDDIK